jgi:hypothetical protein
MGLCLGQPNSDIKTALDLGSAGTILFRSSFRTVVNNAFSGKLVTRFGSHRI